MTATSQEAECCPRFDPAPWDEKVIEWHDKLFLQDRVRSVMHLPLNFGAVMRRCMTAIQNAEAEHEETIVLADENSLWGADVYIAVAKEVPGHRMTRLSGTYHTKVFEGPYRNMRKRIEEMKTYLTSKGAQLGKLLFYYTTCPRCAKKYGRNYVVLLARTNPPT